MPGITPQSGKRASAFACLWSLHAYPASDRVSVVSVSQRSPVRGLAARELTHSRRRIRNGQSAELPVFV